MSLTIFSKSLRALIGAIVPFASTSCTPAEPIAVTDCRVHAVGSDQVSFQANITSHSNRPARRIYVEVVTSGGARIYYELNGRFLPNHRTHQGTIKNVTADPFSLRNHLATIEVCKVFAIIFEDGTHWAGPHDM
jgi:hypothetical protein